MISVTVGRPPIAAPKRATPSTSAVQSADLSGGGQAAPAPSRHLGAPAGRVPPPGLRMSDDRTVRPQRAPITRYGDPRWTAVALTFEDCRVHGSGAG